MCSQNVMSTFTEVTTSLLAVILFCRQQIDLKQKVVTCNSVDWLSADGQFTKLNLIGGVDISFPKNDKDHACACLVILTFPDLKVSESNFIFNSKKPQIT